MRLCIIENFMLPLHFDKNKKAMEGKAINKATSNKISFMTYLFLNLRQHTK